MDALNTHVTSDADDGLKQTLVLLYKKLLQVDAIDEHSSFYQNGGTSLSATLLLAELLSQHGVKLSFDEFDKNNTPASLSKKLCRQSGAERMPAIERRTSYASHEFGLSTAQQSRCWYLSGFQGQRAGDDGMYNSGYAAWLDGRIDFDALARAFNLAARQHDALAMSFAAANGSVVQSYKGPSQIAFSVESAPTPVRDAYAARNSDAGDVYIGDQPLINEFIHTPFDWTQGENLRCRIYTVSETACLLLLAGNHVAFDFMSRGVLLREVGALYNALIDGQSRTGKRPVQYRDYLDWERRYAESAEYSENLSYWIKYLSGSERELNLPTASERSAVRAQDEFFHQDKKYITLDRALTTRVKEAAKSNKLTPYVILFGAYAMTLAKLSGQRRITLGTQIANRRQQEVLDVCGCFAQPVALTCELAAENTVEATLRAVQKGLNEAIEHQPISLPAIAEAMQREGNKRLHPLYQCTFEYFDAKTQPLSLAGAATEELFIPYHFGRTANELMFLLWERDQLLSGVMLYARELHTPAQVEAIAAAYVSSLEALLGAPQATLQQLMPEIYR